MKTKSIGLLALAMAAFLFSADVNAQGVRRPTRVPHYNRTQTISPYAQLFGRNNSGGVTNYFLEVRPRLQMQQQINQLQMNNARQAQQTVQQFQQQNQEMQRIVMGNGGDLLSVRGAQTGRVHYSGSFFNTRNYFSSFGGARAQPAGTNAPQIRAAGRLR